MSMLVRAGLPSRAAAIIAVRAFDSVFLDADGLRQWLRSDNVIAASSLPNWPSIETKSLWRRFRDEFLSSRDPAWSTEVTVLDGIVRPENSEDACRTEFSADGNLEILTPDFRPIGTVAAGFSYSEKGNTYGRWALEGTFEVTHTGPQS